MRKKELIKRLTSWLLSVRCDCVEGGGYCTFCDMANDMLDYLTDESDNSNGGNNESNPFGLGHVEVVVAGPEAEAGTGEDPGASGHEAGREVSEPKGEELNEKVMCPSCDFSVALCIC